MPSGDTAEGAAEEDAAEEALDALQEWLMVRLRTSDGFDLDACAERYGPDAAGTILEALEEARERGLLVVEGGAGAEAGEADGGGGAPGEVPASSTTIITTTTTTKERKLGVARLTDPDGFLFSNDVISTVFAEMGEAELLLSCH